MPPQVRALVVEDRGDVAAIQSVEESARRDDDAAGVRRTRDAVGERLRMLKPQQRVAAWLDLRDAAEEVDVPAVQTALGSGTAAACDEHPRGGERQQCHSGQSGHGIQRGHAAMPEGRPAVL